MLGLGVGEGEEIEQEAKEKVKLLALEEADFLKRKQAWKRGRGTREGEKTAQLKPLTGEKSDLLCFY